MLGNYGKCYNAELLTICIWIKNNVSSLFSNYFVSKKYPKQTDTNRIPLFSEFKMFIWSSSLMVALLFTGPPLGLPLNYFSVSVCLVNILDPTRIAFPHIS